MCRAGHGCGQPGAKPGRWRRLYVGGAIVPVVVMRVALGFLHIQALIAAGLGWRRRCEWRCSPLRHADLAEANGNVKILQDSPSGVTEDRRLQLLIAFGFGVFFEGEAGFGTPVAVTARSLIGMGFSPLASPSCGCELASIGACRALGRACVDAGNGLSPGANARHAWRHGAHLQRRISPWPVSTRRAEAIFGANRRCRLVVGRGAAPRLTGTDGRARRGPERV